MTDLCHAAPTIWRQPFHNAARDPRHVPRTPAIGPPRYQAVWDRRTGGAPGRAKTAAARPCAPPRGTEVTVPVARRSADGTVQIPVRVIARVRRASVLRPLQAMS